MLPIGLLLGPDALAVFGRGEYSDGGALLEVLIGANALAMLGGVAIGVLYALGELRVLLLVTGAVAVTTIVGTYVLLGPLGELSAGIAQLAANALLVALLGRWFRRYLRGSIDRAALLRSAALVGIAFVLGLVCKEMPLVPRLVVALLIVTSDGLLVLAVARPSCRSWAEAILRRITGRVHDVR
jgi:O-antigen/teichoic acid export membrane protein